MKTSLIQAAFLMLFITVFAVSCKTTKNKTKNTPPVKKVLDFFAEIDKEPNADLASVPCPASPEPDPPTNPLGYFLAPDAQSNYDWTKKPENQMFGCTGLVYVGSEPWNSSCYGKVKQFTIFLFPGYYCHTPEDCPKCNPSNLPSINCKSQCPLAGVRSIRDPFHKKMAQLLELGIAGNFMGFSIKFDPVDGMGFGPISGQCNPQFFDDRSLGDCGTGYEWGLNINKFLLTNLK